MLEIGTVFVHANILLSVCINLQKRAAQNVDKFDKCVCPCTPAHYAYTRVNANNSTNVTLTKGNIIAALGSTCDTDDGITSAMMAQ